MTGICIYFITTITVLTILYIFVFGEDGRQKFDSLFEDSIVKNIVLILLLLIAGLPAVIYGVILGIKGDKGD